MARVDQRKSPEVDAALDGWLAENPRHRAAFLRLSVAWRRADELRKLAPLNGEVDEDLLDPARWNGLEPDDDVLEGSVAAVRAEHEESLRSRWHRFAANRAPLRSVRLAASLAVLAVAGLVGFGGWYTFAQSGVETYVTRVGDFHRFALPDGSSVALNTNSEVRVRYTRTLREVQLVRGEALFEVAKNPSRPFDVEAGDTTVRAVGTAFSVRIRDQDRVDVVVSEGRIAINPPSQQTFAAGSVATVRNGRVVATVVSEDDINSRLSWTASRLRFKDAALSEVADEFNRYNARRLVVPDPRVAAIRIGGTFNATDPDAFADTMARMADLRVVRVDGRFGADVIRLESSAP